MNAKGFTLVEVMISVSLLLMALAGISFVYITVNRLFLGENGISGFTKEVLGIQRKQEAPDEFISGMIRSAMTVSVEDVGDTVNMSIPEDAERIDIDYRSVYFEEKDNPDTEEDTGSIYYDPDTTQDGDEQELYKDVYKVSEDGSSVPIFSVDETNTDVINVVFGYFAGGGFADDNKRETRFSVKMRNI